MASSENRSHYEVSVKHRDDLAQTFAHSAKKKAEEYCQSLKAQRFKPKLGRLDNYYVVRDRSVSRKEQTLRATSKAEAEAIQARLESEHKQGPFIDYARGYASRPAGRANLCRSITDKVRAPGEARFSAGCPQHRTR